MPNKCTLLALFIGIAIASSLSGLASPSNRETVEYVAKKYASLLTKIRGVEGVLAGIWRGRECLFAVQASDSSGHYTTIDTKALPSNLGGYPVLPLRVCSVGAAVIDTAEMSVVTNCCYFKNGEWTIAMGKNLFVEKTRFAYQYQLDGTCKVFRQEHDKCIPVNFNDPSTLDGENIGINYDVGFESLCDGAKICLVQVPNSTKHYRDIAKIATPKGWPPVLVVFGIENNGHNIIDQNDSKGSQLR
jgi:hypothetical protein